MTWSPAIALTDGSTTVTSVGVNAASGDIYSVWHQSVDGSMSAVFSEYR
jgi:hypothetical protein